MLESDRTTYRRGRGMGALRYGIAHAVACAAVVCAALAFTLLAYIGLLLWAVLTNAPLGGPLALPLMLLLALAFAIVAVLAVLWPVTTVSALLCRGSGWRRLLQIPLATVLMLAEVFAIGACVALFHRQPVASHLAASAISVLLLLVPLGIYWWSLQATDWLLGLCGTLWRRIWPAA